MNGIYFAVQKKCYCFSFSRIWLIKQISYFITILVKMAQKKVLGITIDNKLDFSTYPSYIIKNFNIKLNDRTRTESKMHDLSKRSF